MNLLTIDTSGEYLSLGVCNAQQQFTFYEKVNNRQAENILPNIDNLLNQANLKLSMLNAIAYNQGPGSFTGLRIGLSVALSLAYVIKCPLIPIPAFMPYLVELNCTNAKNIVIALDARLNQIYLAGINLHDYSYIIEPQLVNPSELARLILQHPQLIAQQTILTGNGFKVYADSIDMSLLHSYQLIEQNTPSTQAMLSLAQSGVFPYVDYHNADLLYIRNKVALNLTEQQQQHK